MSKAVTNGRFYVDYQSGDSMMPIMVNPTNMEYSAPNCYLPAHSESCCACNNDNYDIEFKLYPVIYQPKRPIFGAYLNDIENTYGKYEICLSFAEFPLCEFHRKRADIVMKSSDHLATGIDWFHIAEYIKNILNSENWQEEADKRNQRKAEEITELIQNIAKNDNKSLFYKIPNEVIELIGKELVYAEKRKAGKIIFKNMKKYLKKRK